MNVLEQVCQTPATHQVHRILILCDRDGFANMKKFLCENLSDCVYYIDEWAVSINELFIMTDDEDYLISCDDYTFHNLVNVVLCSQTSNPMKNVPSLFYDLFTNEANKDIVDRVREICNIDYHVLEGSLDNNSYEIMHNVDWSELSENAIKRHLFIGAEIITNFTLSDKIQQMLNNSTCWFSELDYSYIRPLELDSGSKEYKLWYDYVTNATNTKYQLINKGVSWETAKQVLPACTARQVNAIASLGEWTDFFKAIEKSRMIANNPNDRDLVRRMADYMRDYAYTDDFDNVTKHLIQTIDSYEELPF